MNQHPTDHRPTDQASSPKSAQQHPTPHDGKIALREHAIDKAYAARTRFGPVIDLAAINQIIEDRELVRFPVRVVFDARDLEPGEFAHAQPVGTHPGEGFLLLVHPSLEHRHDVLPAAIAYHIPPINYGDIADADDCLVFGAALLGLSVDAYYEHLCELADSLNV